MILAVDVVVAMMLATASPAFVKYNRHNHRDHDYWYPKRNHCGYTGAIGIGGSAGAGALIGVGIKPSGGSFLNGE